MSHLSVSVALLQQDAGCVVVVSAAEPGDVCGGDGGSDAHAELLDDAESYRQSEGVSERTESKAKKRQRWRSGHLETTVPRAATRD